MDDVNVLVASFGVSLPATRGIATREAIARAGVVVESPQAWSVSVLMPALSRFETGVFARREVAWGYPC